MPSFLLTDADDIQLLQSRIHDYKRRREMNKDLEKVHKRKQNWTNSEVEGDVSFAVHKKR